MANLFGILFLLSMVALVVGIIKPEKILFFIPKEKQNKKNAILIFGLIMFISFVGVGITADNTNIVEKEEVKKEKDKKEEPKKKMELNKLQELYLSFNDDIIKEDVENKIAENGLSYTEEEYTSGPSIKIALTKDQSLDNRLDPGDYVKVAFNKELEVEVVEYFDNDKSLTLIDYRQGIYWDLRDQPEYKGYYINSPGKELGSFKVKYDNGNQAETGYLKVDSKEEQLDYLSTYER